MGLASETAASPGTWRAHARRLPPKREQADTAWEQVPPARHQSAWAPPARRLAPPARRPAHPARHPSALAPLAQTPAPPALRPKLSVRKRLAPPARHLAPRAQAPSLPSERPRGRRGTRARIRASPGQARNRRSPARWPLARWPLRAAASPRLVCRRGAGGLLVSYFNVGQIL